MDPMEIPHPKCGPRTGPDYDVTPFEPSGMFLQPVEYGDVEAIRADMRRRWKRGCYCPACEQHVQVYANPFRWSAAAVLVLMERRLRLHPEQVGVFIHWPSFAQAIEVRGKDPQDAAKKKAALIGGGGCVVSRLVHWGLWEGKPEARVDLDWRNGYYRMTPLGRRVASGEVLIPRRTYNYNGRVLAFGGPLISIEQALGERFNYAQLLAGEA